MSREHPTVIFINMIQRATIFDRKSKIAAVCGLRSKFNLALEDACAKQNQRILQIQSCSSIDHFDTQGNLTSSGKLACWKEIDDLLEQFDRGKISLQAR